MPEIKDSGARREFESGAVRDVQEGKGRCDLLPIDIVGCVVASDTHRLRIFQHISDYVRDGEPNSLILAITEFCMVRGWCPETAMLEVAIHYENGAKKYVERNWEKGIPLHCYIDSGVRHLLKHLRGDEDEPHDRAFLWNIMCAVWTHDNLPGMIDLPFRKESEEKHDETDK